MVRFLEVARTALAVLGVAGTMACTATAANQDHATPMRSVTGTVTYRERVALPPTAVIKVQIVDVSRADAPALVVGEQTIQADGRQVPFAFEIAYNPTKIEANHSYAVQARIEENGELRFINDQRYAVITRGAPTAADLVLKAVAHSPK